MPRKAPARSSRARTRKALPVEAASTEPVESFVELPMDEKRALMLAHAERRASHPTGNVFGMYLGVAICTILILVGWALALPRTLASGGDRPDGAIEAIKRNASAFGQSFEHDGERLQNTEEAAETLIEIMRKQNEAAKN